MKEIPDFPNFPGSTSADILLEMTTVVFGDSVTPKPCDLIFVFGGIDPGLWKTALKAYEQQLGGKLLITGGVKTQGLDPRSTGDVPESMIMRQALIRSGVPDSSITVETRSTNTYENVRFAMEEYDFSQVISVLAICASRGVGRQCRTLKHASPTLEVRHLSFDSKIRQRDGLLTPENWKLDAIGRSYVWGQILRIHEYGQRGHLTPLDDTSEELSKLIETASSELS